MYCRYCGKMIEENAAFCRFCGSGQNSQKVVVKLDQASGLDMLIPSNTMALWAYYLGIFTLVCFIAAIPAFVTGILGVRYANEHPEAKGKVHAWVGIILGALGILLWIPVIGMMIYKAVSGA